jgi:hypothetical protein
MARPGSVGSPASGMSAPRGARPYRHAGLPDPPDHPGDHAPRRGELPCCRPRRVVPPALADRHLTGASQDHEADGGVARPNGARCPEGTHRLCHRLQPRAHGHAALCHASTHHSGAEQLPRCAAVARRTEHREPVRSVERQSHSTASRATTRQKTAAQGPPLDDQTPASSASAVWYSKSSEANFMPFRSCSPSRPTGRRSTASAGLACRRWTSTRSSTTTPRDSWGSSTKCRAPQTVSDGLANNADCEPTFSAHMRGVGSTITANEPTFRVLWVVSQIFVRMPFRVRYPLSSMTSREEVLRDCVAHGFLICCRAT